MDFLRFMAAAVGWLGLLQLMLYGPLVDLAVNGQETAATWMLVGVKEVEQALQNFQPMAHRAKNVVLFLGDGMGISTVTAARILKGGESSRLFFERFPNTGLSKTYCADYQVTDSAASSTAFQCGVKTNKGVLGLDPRVPRNDCRSSLKDGMQLTSILDWSLAAGKSVGLVTNTRITHATPAGAYANSADRAWEGDSKLSRKARRDRCRDIARQLIEDYPDVQVIMGGGRRYFLPRNATDPSTGESNSYYGRRDFRDLTKEWLGGQEAQGRQAAYVWNAEQLRQLDLNATDYLLGLFAQSHMDYESERKSAEQPSLAEMTQAAITILSRNPKGFYLLVEGGRIDHSHHDNSAYNALHDTLAFDAAVEAASSLTSVSDTLTITTADHSHTMVIAGYQTRGSPIFNVVDDAVDEDGNTFTTLLYGEGPGYRYGSERTSITNRESNAPYYQQESAVPLESASHGGEDVAVYAQGPMSHLASGVHEQNFLAHLMAFASCVGHFHQTNHCPPSLPEEADLTSSSSLSSFYFKSGVTPEGSMNMTTVSSVVFTKP